MAPPLGKWLYTKSQWVAIWLISGRRVTFLQHMTDMRLLMRSLVMTCTVSFLDLPLRLFRRCWASRSMGAPPLAQRSSSICCRIFWVLDWPKSASSTLDVWLRVRYWRVLPRRDPLDAELPGTEYALPGWCAGGTSNTELYTENINVKKQQIENRDYC